MKRAWYLGWEADCEGNWFVGDDPRGVYPTREEAEAAWAAAYRGPDPYGAEARPVIVEVEVDEPEDGYVWVETDTPAAPYAHGLQRWVRR